MEESTKNAEAKQVKKRKHRPLVVAQSSAEKTHIMIPAMCSTSIYRLRGELGLNSCGAAIQWLVHHARHDLIPVPEPPTKTKSSKTCPSCKTDSVDHDSIPKPACMAREDVDAPVSDFPITSPATRFPVRATVVQASTVFFDTPAIFAFVGGYPRCVRFDASNLTEEDDSLQRYYASAIDMPGESPFDRL
ncbi:hypothetical protein OIU77_030997 [Salix suchowensis]|uniref:TCP domain-containing protein n=1 Tax=Salix suchowensis TaxID=1278906 RepID=A0ABQ9BDY6_9ROSI|nr:hypothetical protein OIU77_030997 [Salix suchowensis]